MIYQEICVFLMIGLLFTVLLFPNIFPFLKSEEKPQDKEKYKSILAILSILEELTRKMKEFEGRLEDLNCKIKGKE